MPVRTTTERRVLAGHVVWKTLVVLAVSFIPYSANAFTNLARRGNSFKPACTECSLGATNHRGDVEIKATPKHDLFEVCSRAFLSVAAPLALSTSLLVAPLPFSTTAQAIEPANAATQTKVSPIATSIDIDLKGLPALTRKAIANRDALQKYLIESAKSFKPILQLLSESDTVTVTPPKDVKKAINSLLGGEAQFVVNNGDLVDVRVESVPGVVIVRIISPNIPRLPFLKDGSAAIKFVDQMVDAAPKELERASEEVLAVEKFLTWGAPEKKEQITFAASPLGGFMSSKFELNGKAVSFGKFDLTNSEVICSSLGVGIVGVYGASYAYYVQLQEDAEREAAEKKAAAVAKRKAKADEQAKAAAEAKSVENDEIPKPVMEVDSTVEDEGEGKDQVEEGYSAAATVAAASDKETTTVEAPKRMRKRDALKRMFGKRDSV